MGEEIRPEKILPRHKHGVYSLAWHPDGKLLAVGAGHGIDFGGVGHGTILLWDSSTWAISEILREPVNWNDTVRCLSWSPDGTYLASGHDDGQVRIWKPSTRTLVRTLKWNDFLYHMLGTPLWGPIRRYARLARETLQGHRDWVTSIAWSPDGKRLASGSRDKTVRIWDPFSKAPVGKAQQMKLDFDNGIVSVYWNPDGAKLGIWPASTRYVHLWDLSTQFYLEPQKLEDVEWIKPEYTNPDGTCRALIWQKEEQPMNRTVIEITEILTRRKLKTLAADSEWIMTIAWSPDGARLASGSSEGTVRIWSLSSA